jgi:site-specific recombinase XerD
MEESKRGRKKGASGLPVFKSGQFNDVFVSVTLDTRKGKEGELRVVGRVAFDRRQIYVSLGKSYTIEKFQKVITTKNNFADDRLFLEERYSDLLNAIKDIFTERSVFSLEALKDRFSQRSSGKDSIYDVWQGIVDDYRKDDRIGTADSYSQALSRFKKDNGERVMLTAINRTFLEKWVAKMRRELSPTSVGIYLRAFRVVVKQAVTNGLLDKSCSLMFTDLSAVNDGNDRKNEFLDVPTMRKLYDFFIAGEILDADGNEKYHKDYKEKLLEATGLFLFMYLANGLNLADAARLKYDDFYFSQGKRLMCFIRHKTHKTTSRKTEVVFPILPEIRAILDRIAQPETKNTLVFNIIKDRMDEQRKDELIAQMNSNIRDRIRVVCKHLGIEQEPSPTWCRHSFATNLRDAGLPIEYISSMMGHTVSSGSSTTLRYLSDYNEATMIANNSKLLNLHSEKADMMAKLASLSEEQLASLLKTMGEQATNKE